MEIKQAAVSAKRFVVLPKFFYPALHGVELSQG